MSPGTVTTFFAVLLLGGAAGLCGVATSRQLRRQVAGSALGLSALVAVGATFGSLYLSEIADYLPCELCWFQRVAMYPLAIMLPLAAWLQDRSILRYALGLAVAGAAVSVYHIQLQAFPDQGSMCDATNPCSGRWVEAFGWMTIPQMAGISFALIIGVIAIAMAETRKDHS